MSTALSEIRVNKSWEELLSSSLHAGEDLAPLLNIDPSEINAVLTRYPMRINPYYLGLIRNPGDGIYEQAVPDIREIMLEKGTEDPLCEERLSPVPGLTHKYPDRVLFLVCNHCAMYCRFCNRKRMVGRTSTVTRETIREGLSYIKKSPRVRDVLLSGGDPLLLQDRKIFEILTALRAIPHVEIIRIGTRVPCTLPQRITPALARLLRGFHPLYVSTHFNHPAELTPEAAGACARLADAGIPLGCQTVLLRGVNDRPAVMVKLMRGLLSVRVRPYYLFQADMVRGTSHFWTPLQRGMDIISVLSKKVPGPGLPQFVIDLPGGGGKVPMAAGAEAPVCNKSHRMKKDESKGRHDLSSVTAQSSQLLVHSPAKGE